jgi:hypothetical protein
MPADDSREADEEVHFHVRPGDGSVDATATVSMTLLAVVTTNRPPVTEATVRIANRGDVTVRPRLSAVDDWSPAGPVPAEPPEVELRRGRHRDVRVRVRRPLVPVIGRHRSGTVTVYADLDGAPIPGPVYPVPPLVSRVAALVAMTAVAVLIAGLGAVVLRPAGGPERPAPDAATAVVEPSSPLPAAPGPPADPNALPADVLFDDPTNEDANAHEPVLVGRDRSMVFLPPGGPVTAAVKVPSGWIVKRQTAGGTSGIRSRVLYLRDGEALDLAPGLADPSFFVDETGTRVAIDGRDGTDGVITVLSLPGAAADTTTPLPAHVRVIAWFGEVFVVGVRDATGSWQYGRWSIADPYEELPGAISGSFLGAAGGGAVTVHQRDGELDCIVQVSELVRPAKQALRCGFGVPVDTDVLSQRWSAVSPGGRFLVVPGPNRSAHFAPLPAMLRGLVGFAPAVRVPGPVLDVAWRDGTTAALLVRGDDAQIWTCTADRIDCRATPVDRPNDLAPVQLVPRVPAGG